MSKEKIVCGLLCVGTEITEGGTQDKHVQYLSAMLHSIYVEVSKAVIIPDHRERFLNSLNKLIDENDLVIVTGGLGPTSDDMTREVVAEAAKLPLEFHEDIWQWLEKRFAGRKLSLTNKRQAYLPAGFTKMENPNGTAPGFWGKVRDSLVFSLPGPPKELLPMTENILIPRVLETFNINPPSEKRLSVFLLGESRLEQGLLENRVGKIEWSTRAEPYRILLTLRDGSQEELEGFASQLRKSMGSSLIREGDLSAPEIVFKALRENKAMLSAAESCTGGLLTKLLTDISGTSDILWGGFVVYSNEAKIQLLGISPSLLEQHGAVSEETALAMAKAAKAKGGTDFGLAITGIAGPGGGSREKPIGTVWIAVAGPEGNKALLFNLYGTRDMIRRRSAVAACLMLESVILNNYADFWKTFKKDLT